MSITVDLSKIFLYAPVKPASPDEQPAKQGGEPGGGSSSGGQSGGEPGGQSGGEPGGGQSGGEPGGGSSSGGQGGSSGGSSGGGSRGGSSGGSSGDGEPGGDPRQGGGGSSGGDIDGFKPPSGSSGGGSRGGSSGGSSGGERGEPGSGGSSSGSSGGSSGGGSRGDSGDDVREPPGEDGEPRRPSISHDAADLDRPERGGGRGESGGGSSGGERGEPGSRGGSSGGHGEPGSHGGSSGGERGEPGSGSSGGHGEPGSSGSGQSGGERGGSSGGSSGGHGESGSHGGSSGGSSGGHGESGSHGGSSGGERGDSEHGHGGYPGPYVGQPDKPEGGEKGEPGGPRTPGQTPITLDDLLDRAKKAVDRIKDDVTGESRKKTSDEYEKHNPEHVRDGDGITKKDIEDLTRAGDKKMTPEERKKFLENTQKNQDEYENLKKSKSTEGMLNPDNMAKLLGTKRVLLVGNVLGLFQRMIEEAVSIHEEVDQNAASRKVEGLYGAPKEVTRVGSIAFLLDASGSMNVDMFKQGLKAIDYYIQQYFSSVETAFVTVWGDGATTKRISNIKFNTVASLYRKEQIGKTGDTQAVKAWTSLLRSSQSSLDVDVFFFFSDFKFNDDPRDGVPVLRKIAKRLGNKIIYVATISESPKCAIMDQADSTWRRRLIHLAPLASSAQQKF